MIPELGIIEGFYGKPWTWKEREETAAFLAPHGYRFYHYAPKADLFLRRRWQEPHPAEEARGLAGLSRTCRSLGVRFGVGLSPYEIYLDFNDDVRDALTRKLAFLDEIGIDDLAILFDDMRGDVATLAERQAEIAHWMRERSAATRILVCPSYYTDDPILDRIFGRRPDNYLEDLGSLLDPSIQILWTGEEVCSREFTPGHLARVASQLGRKPFLWDNYPVNDGPRMSQFLHLRAFTGRPAGIAPHIAAHGVNPASQPVLSRVPALTLVEAYAKGDAYQYGGALSAAAELVLGPDLARSIVNDLLVLNDSGLDRLTPSASAKLRARYAAFDHPAAREIVDWLDGGYRITQEIIDTQ
ncbi:MAG: beta-N-acetylglucosaminidase domain-containing protein [Parvibaculum sp.]|uniref:beta-N-acetylglucosaminidase domain-containing protein n=1 Tax=Parvibaculum sp. TaxID=2024848 RepID=UPI0025D43203|nr:beta-N-acetylglucosaminidase domain-containing protein [Parvibaculum sp.]MCE9650529.1 beta-N-acetylglucosaminidase domain-containing protein [Parvibaculum sp.]